jgi:hypothetical protein
LRLKIDFAKSIPTNGGARNHLIPRSFFCTFVHKFAQSSSAISVDAANGREYLARQIEPEAKNFTAQFKRRGKLKSGLRRELNREARGFPLNLESATCLTAVALPG